jgi:hypothetical protein
MSETSSVVTRDFLGYGYLSSVLDVSALDGFSELVDMAFLFLSSL